MDEKIVSPEQAFAMAIDAAEKAAPFVSPNPLVGCVVVDENHNLLSIGYHTKYGSAHAEFEALKNLKAEQLKNAIVYVTLEPCAHEGKTPSCAKMLAKLPIKKVIYGLQDPNPLVSGQGAEILKQAGIEATEYQGAMKAALKDLCEVFLKNFRQKKLFIAAKIATSLDGQIALKSGESRWITGPDSRIQVHALRARYDSIIIGRNTIEVDDPSLDIRHDEIKKETKLIILDSSSKILRQIKEGKKFKFLNSHTNDNIYFAVSKIDLSLGYKQLVFNSLISLHQEMWKVGIRSAFIEGGAETYSRYLNENLIDRLHLFIAPSIIGAVRGLSWAQNVVTNALADKKVMQNIRTDRFGDDIYITGKFES